MKIINENEFEATIANGVVLVDFFATWCGPCKMLTPVLEELSEELAGKIEIVKVDVDQSSNLAMRFNIMSVPTMLIFKNGQGVGTLQGYASKPQLLEKLQQYL